jgi:solute carrier family 13 (sodium-dependent dicarboxylate transporter), member 2/3/5
LPLVLITLVLCWLLLIRLFPARRQGGEAGPRGTIRAVAQRRSLYAVFGLTALLWFTEQQHGISSNIVAFLPVVALPMLGVIGKKEIHALPWDVFWLMGGGISLGTAIRDTGLAPGWSAASTGGPWRLLRSWPGSRFSRIFWPTSCRTRSR